MHESLDVGVVFVEEEVEEEEGEEGERGKERKSFNVNGVLIDFVISHEGKMRKPKDREVIKEKEKRNQKG